MEDDELRPGRHRDAGGVVEHADRHVQLLAPLGVAHEAGDRRVHRERDVVLARELAEPLGEVVVHPEAALEVDLARREARVDAGPRPRLRALASGNTGRAEVQLPRHRPAEPSRDAIPSDAVYYPSAMAERPSRIDLLELDIDLRLADLWREAAGIEEWSLEVVAAFMRAAYGKGYCDALTEELPGSLCADHGYRVPERGPRPVDADRLARSIAAPAPRLR